MGAHVPGPFGSTGYRQAYARHRLGQYPDVSGLREHLGLDDMALSRYVVTAKTTITPDTPATLVAGEPGTGAPAVTLTGVTIQTGSRLPDLQPVDRFFSDPDFVPGLVAAGKATVAPAGTPPPGPVRHMVRACRAWARGPATAARRKVQDRRSAR